MRSIFVPAVADFSPTFNEMKDETQGFLMVPLSVSSDAHNDGNIYLNICPVLIFVIS